MSQYNVKGSGGGGGGVITIDGDSGSVTGSTVTFTGGSSGAFFTGAGTTMTETFNFLSMAATDTSGNGVISMGGSSVFQTLGTWNTYVGPGAGNLTFTIGSSLANTGVGRFTLFQITTGAENTGIGANSGQSVTSGSNNTILGSGGATALSIGNSNTILGRRTAENLTAGSSNIVIGELAGDSYTGTETNNILIGTNVVGVVGESNTLHIGDTGGGITACFINGIDGVTVTGSAVLCSATGQLGDVVSSRQFKENIQDVELSLLSLRPVSFNYKSDKEKTVCFGMIAEEVEKILPQLVLYKDGKPYSLKYHEMPALLLAEIQRLNKRIEALEAK